MNKNIRKLVREIAQELLEYKSYETNIGRITPSKDNKTLYLDKYGSIDKQKFSKLLKIFDIKKYNYDVIKSGSITTIQFDKPFNWNKIEKYIEKI